MTIFKELFEEKQRTILASNNLDRFVEAQSDKHSGYDIAFSEIKNGHKDSHWIWYIFPQLKGLGHSTFATYYGITDAEEARMFMNHKILGPRLREISQELLNHKGKPITTIVPPIDSIKICSCMTLFDAICPNDIFREVIKEFYNDESDSRTLEMLKEPKIS